uniref:Uncharacterized protein n=1 Tax=Acinetobacter nosocomialis TaxID=106654 RepID=A0A7S9DQF9_ACINO|nr:hypothetical protein WM98B_00136 [Acinetobacter nosocomialis]
MGRRSRRAARHERRLHAHSPEARGVPAGRADDAGAGARIDLRGGRHLLRGQARAVGGGHRRADRNLSVPAVFDRDRVGDGGHRDRRPPHRRASRRGGCAVRGAGHLGGGAGLAALRAGRNRVGAGAAAADGGGRLGHRARLSLYPVDARRQCGDPAAVRHQRHLSRSGRRSRGDARAMGRQCAQHRARSDPDLRPRADPGARHRGRGDRDQHRARRRRADAGVDPGARQRTPAHPPRQPALAWCDAAADRAHLVRRDRPDDRVDDRLDLPDAHPRQRLDRGRGGGDDHDPHHDVHPDARLGHVQRRRHAGRAEPRRGSARTCRGGRVAHRLDEHGVHPGGVGGLLLPA